MQGGVLEPAPYAPITAFSSGAETYYIKFQGGHMPPILHGSTRLCNLSNKYILQLTFALAEPATHSLCNVNGVQVLPDLSVINLLHD